MKWGKVKVGDCCEVTSSKRIFFSEYVDSGVPFYRSKEIIESSNGQAISEPLFISQEKYDEIKNHFENEMEDWERAEYNNCFDDYLACCMWFNGGTLSVYEGD